MSTNATPDQLLTRTLLDTLIRAGLIAALVVACYQVFSPFLSLMVWALILAVTLYPLHGMLKRRLGGGEGRSATLLVLIAIAILLVPAYLLGASLTESVQSAIAVVKEGNLHIPAPPDTVAQWPLIGKPLHAVWAQAAADMSSVLQQIAPHVKDTALGLLGKLAGAGLGLLAFIGSLVIAGIIMAYGESGHRSAQRISSRIVDPSRSDMLVDLCTATIRAVAQGVIGIAFIQMMLIAVAFVLMGVPGAGLLALAVLLLGIMQLPATLITLPVIAFVFFSEGVSLLTIIFAIYTFVAGLADNVLKPMLLGRGVDVPMPVVLIGALGGMVSGGIIGLFIGPVLLAVGYKLFWQWVETPAIEAAGPQDGK
ncbi:AI-2E family transporter [Aquipseudomonas campi]|uniref:AI-2E family transporter n=1 Tax=Aquipseudomonas campi TaxID=2731681 RepID=A0A6M8FI32_9GAMM|nr:AI-2E family transporter [Pseudomonas campi]QKE63629.1 AI-2E family transporter [Pseudomonas campi]